MATSTAKTGVQIAIDKAGGRTKFGNALSPPVSAQAVYEWVKRGWVPPLRALEIEQRWGVDRALLVKPAFRDLVGDPVHDA